ncbi:hypothetical protein ALP79_200293 [Pseudomonas savastanoi pv. fraxini]|nr:hypothetical protein ALP79_200293 [Pseudomonas savastanoi pv. fraxini]RML68117.1 hypothetical protein ALQ90_200244 [Pseudomonas savastanoi pv. savastanoi]
MHDLALLSYQPVRLVGVVDLDSRRHFPGRTVISQSGLLSFRPVKTFGLLQFIYRVDYDIE